MNKPWLENPGHRDFTSKSVTSLEGIRPFKIPETCSAPTTFRRRRRHVADQVYVTSTSIPYLTLNFIDDYQKGSNCESNNESDKNTPYYNTSSYASDDVDQTTNPNKRYAAFRSISKADPNTDAESQEITIFLESLSDCCNYDYDFVNSDEDFDSFDSESDSEFVHVHVNQVMKC